MSDYALYLDDSGHPSNAPFVVSAGFIATESGWLALEKDWNDALDSHGVDKPFHMTDFMARYKNQRVKRSLVLRDLAAIIGNHTLGSFSGAVDIAAYKRVNEKYALQECLGAPYALASRGMAVSLNKWRKQVLSPGDQLVIFAERGTKDRGDMEQVFQRDKLPIPVPVEKGMPAVQPADMLAWELNRCLRNNQKLERRLARLVKASPDSHTVFAERNLLETINALAATAHPVRLRKDIPPNARYVFHSNKKRVRKRTY